MLNRCNALVFSADGRWSEAFCTNLKSIGFGETFCVCDFDDLERAISRQNINFCYFSQTSHIDQIRAAMSAIRGYRDDELRFSPVILMAREISRNSLSDYISIGFDDIVRFPCTIDMLSSRTKRQLNTELRYYETESYFGPDRRNYFAANASQLEQRNGSVPYRRHSIQRDVFKGIEITDVFDHKPPGFLDEENEKRSDAV